jgi:hypothetical protein
MPHAPCPMPNSPCPIDISRNKICVTQNPCRDVAVLRQNNSFSEMSNALSEVVRVASRREGMPNSLKIISHFPYTRKGLHSIAALNG